MNARALEIRKLTHDFGGLRAVSEVDLNLEPQELIGLIGPNGSGKTTIFNLITGVYRASEGEINFFGQPLVGLPSHVIAQKGIARTFQTIRVYSDLSVLDNVILGHHFRGRYGLMTAIARLPGFYVEEREVRARAKELLALFHLDRRTHELARNLPYGEQRRLEICRALAAEPRLLLLDEPAAGMNPQEVVELMDLIQWVHDHFKLAIVLIEHQMQVIMGVCPHIVVLNFGQVIARGSPAEIQNNELVIEAYLGKDEPV